MRSRFWLILGVIVPMASLAHAQPLADRVPADAMIYIGWSGTESMGPEFENSHLKAVLDASDVPKIATDFIPAIFEKVGRRDADARKVGEVLKTIITPMWTHPTAVYFSGLDFPDAGPPMPKFAALCNAGADAPALVAKVKQIITEAGESPVPISVSEADGLVSLVIGKAGDLSTKISDARGFKTALAKTHAKPVAVVYVNGESLIQQIDIGIQKSGDRKALREWPKLRASLGLDSFKAGIWTAAFDQQNWSTRVFIASPAPRTGIFKLLDSTPLPPDTLKVVPESSIIVGAGRLDLAALMDGIHEMLVSIEPRAANQWDRGFKQLNDTLRMDLRNDVLGPIGDTWVYYVDPMTGGNGILGAVIVNKLRDPAKAEASLERLQGVINDFLERNLRQAEVKIRIKVRSIDGQVIHYLATPLITPTWAFKDGQLVIGLYPQTVIAAVRNLGTGGKSILDNPAYVAMRKQLGDTPAASVQFADLPKLAPASYSSWLLISRYAGIGDLFGIDSPLMILPPIHILQEHLSASGAVNWSTDEGFFFRSISPFPGSEIVASDPLSTVGVAQPALMASILLPSLNKARETANRVKCQSNMVQIGKGFLLYSNENKGKLPPDLGMLVTNEDLTADVFTCPSDEQNEPLPTGWRQMKADEQAKWVNEHSHYVYLKPAKGFLTATTADDILVYEKPGSHGGDGMNILFGDCHAEFYQMADADRMIEEQKKKNEGGK